MMKKMLNIPSGNFSLMQLININDIILDINSFDTYDVFELSDDIEMNGIKTAVILTKEGNKYNILNGRKRVAVFKILNMFHDTEWAYIPSVIFDLCEN